MAVSYFFLFLTVKLETNLFWLSLLITVGLALYFTKVFFKKKPSIENLFMYLSMLGITILYFALIYMVFGLQGDAIAEGTKPTLEQAIYFSIVTWTTLGYGDLTPTRQSMPWAMVEVMLGYIFMAILAGKVLALVNYSNNDKDS